MIYIVLGLFAVVLIAVAFVALEEIFGEDYDDFDGNGW